MYFMIATVINDAWERTFHGRRFSPWRQAAGAGPGGGGNFHGGQIQPVATPGDPLATIDSLIDLPETDRGHWKAGMSAGLNDELEQVRGETAAELERLHLEIDDLRARLAAALARAEAAEAQAASCTCGGGGQ